VSALEDDQLVFSLGDEAYAIGLRHVREVLEMAPLTPVPGAPTAVRGVMNLRGQVVPVVDLGRRFDRPACTITKWTCVIVVETDLDGERIPLGIIADSVDELASLSAAEVAPVPAFGTGIPSRFLLGLAPRGTRFLLVLDADRLLSAQELLALDTAANAEPS
jgi:purine-binding chemotaxis protein CheW